LLYAGIHNSWTNSLQLGEHDRYQVREDFTNGGRGHPPKHLKFFLLVFSKKLKKITDNAYELSEFVDEFSPTRRV